MDGLGDGSAGYCTYRHRDFGVVTESCSHVVGGARTSTATKNSDHTLAALHPRNHVEFMEQSVRRQPSALLREKKVCWLSNVEARSRSRILLSAAPDFLKRVVYVVPEALKISSKQRGRFQ